MRILACISSMDGGGAERQLAYLASELTRLGWDMHVALLSGGPNLRRLEAGGATIHRLTARGNYDPTILWQLVRLMRRVRPDVAETWITQMDVLGGLAARLTRTPWILRERSSEPAYPATGKHRWRLRVARGASAVISNSTGGDRYWAGHLGERVRRYVIGNALPIREIGAVRPADEHEAGVQSGARLVLSVGRLAPEKNFDILLSALRRVLDDPRIVVVLCGEGPLRPTLERALTEQGIADRVRLPGYVPDVWGWMKRADVFVSVSRFEGQPNAVLEAMTCGCPLVVSDIPAHRSFLDEAEAALVPVDDPVAIAEAIRRAVAGGEDVTRRAARAQAATAAWSVEAMTRCVVDVYRAVLTDHGGSRPRDGGNARQVREHRP
jgi:glycosyltransferase involved in cell wall biosynthesis